MARPSIVFLNRVYPPADGATGELLAELAPELVKAGWEVTVITGPAPGAPRCQIISGVRVERVRGLPLRRSSHLQRALSCVGLYPLLFWRALQVPRADVVVTLTDPPLLCLLGPLLRAWKGSKLVHWAQDLYPELAEAMGVLPRHGWSARLLRRLSTWALSRSDKNIAIGHCMALRLSERGVPPETIEVIPNWGQVRREPAGAPAENSFRREHGLVGKFVVMYSGNLGLAHPFEAVLDAAERLQSVLPQVLFLFVGKGPRLPWVIEQTQRRNLANVRFLPFQPRENLQQNLCAGDVHLATMRDDLVGLVVPSKVYGVLAAGRPCLFLGPPGSEAAQLILREGCGAVLPPADGVKLAECLKDWVTDPVRWQQMQRRSQAVASQVGLSSSAPVFVRILTAVMRGPSSQHRAVLAPGHAPLSARLQPGHEWVPLSGRLGLKRRFPARFSTRIAKAGGPSSDGR